MAFKTDHLPKTKEEWEEEFIHRLVLASGIDPHTLGPNIRQVISVLSESLHVQNQLFIELYETHKVKVDK